MKPTKFHYPNWANEVAEQIGMHRANNNRKLDKAQPKYVRPDKYHVLGALGEIVFLIYLSTMGKKYEANVLFGDKPVVGYDVIIEDKYLVDVKTIGKDTRFLSVGTREHKKIGKDITHYAFMKMHGQNVCDIYRCEKKEVESWQIGTTKWENEVKEYFKFNL